VTTPPRSDWLRASAAADWPTLAEVRKWLDVPVSELTDAMLADVYTAEVELQIEYCDTDPYRFGLRMALFRRCARAAAARGLPLGTLPIQTSGYGDASSYGAMLLPRIDAEIERYEGPWRKIAIA
jgi:hypothetical protein